MRRDVGPYIIAAGIWRTVRLTTLAVPTAARPTAPMVCTAADETAEAALTATHPASAETTNPAASKRGPMRSRRRNWLRVSDLGA